MQLVVHAQRTLEEPQDLNKPVFLDRTGHYMIERVSRPAGSGFARQVRSQGIPRIHPSEKIVGQHMLQKEMEGMSMVMMTKMTELMQEDIILKNFRQADYVQIQIYIVP